MVCVLFNFSFWQTYVHHLASLKKWKGLLKALSVWQFWHLNIGNVPWTAREIFSFYWQKKIFGQFATLEAVKSREKFTQSLCQPHWSQDLQIKSKKSLFFVGKLKMWVWISENVGGSNRRHTERVVRPVADNTIVTNKNSGQLSSYCPDLRKLRLGSELKPPHSTWRGSK